MKLHFLGTGGGRNTTAKQIRNTSGIILETEETSIYIDPGPGSIVHCQNYNTEKIKGAIITHGHLDHYSDAEPIIELISFRHKNPCKLMASESVLNGHGNIRPSISQYHREMCTETVNLSEKDAELEGLKVESQEMLHNDPKCQGLKISDSKETIGFWSDSSYSEELTKFYQECDTIVINCLGKKDSDCNRHTSLDDIPEILENCEASTAIITHFGEAFLNSDMEEQKEWLSSQVSQKVIFAEDKMSFPGEKKLDSF